MKIAHKFFSHKVKSIDEANYTAEFVISDESVDRYNEVIKQDGWNFENFKKNNIFMWDHWGGNLNNILGVVEQITTDVIIDGIKSTVARVKFDIDDETPEADPIRKAWRLVKNGTLKTVSVGFINHNQDGNELLENELIELSLVAIPANPNAIALGMRDGTISKDDAEWLEKTYRKSLDNLTDAKNKGDNNDDSTDSELSETVANLVDLVGKLNDKLDDVSSQMEQLKAAKDDAPEPSDDDDKSDDPPSKTDEGDDEDDSDSADDDKPEGDEGDSGKDGDDDTQSGTDDELTLDDLTEEQQEELVEAVAAELNNNKED